MPDNKTAEKKLETAAAPAEEKKAVAKKAPAAKKPAEKKATAAAKKPAEKKAPAAKKPAEKKATTAKKPAEKKATAAKKPAAKKTAAAAVDVKVEIQALGSAVNTNELVAKATKASGVKDVKKVDVYVKPEVNKVYYVVNGDNFGDFDLF
ncbi:DUF6465 family protein [Ruminococcus flavefaciens]|uniref:DUF6465 family protein n=1 Tax=Ruminococcus flavefaciens TaxID=1265 RepID=UPI000313328E|nr:DUF6465 family protein [Ruminococcus flavefaciens]